MKYVILPLTVFALLSACQEASQQPAIESAEVEATSEAVSEAADQYAANYVGKYALEDGCGEGKPVVELTADKVNWGETSCSIDKLSLNEEGLVQIAAKECTAEGEAQADRSYTIEAGGMMGVEFTSGDVKTSAKRCEAFDAG